MKWKPIVEGLGAWTMLIFVGWIIFGSSANSADLTHKWKSPSFSGIGTSAHFLTIENQEFTRKADIRAKEESEIAKKLATAKNTNYAKFIDNLESRIYAEFSKQLTDNLFGEPCGTTYTTTSVTDTTVDPAVTTTTTTQDTPNPQEGNSVDGADTIVGSNCTGTYTFNDTTVTYTKDVTNDVVTLDIAGPDGSQVITLPLNDFQF